MATASAAVCQYYAAGYAAGESFAGNIGTCATRAEASLRLLQDGGGFDLGNDLITSSDSGSRVAPSGTDLVNDATAVTLVERSQAAIFTATEVPFTNADGLAAVESMNTPNTAEHAEQQEGLAATLAVELLLSIFSRLPMIFALETACWVCRHWRTYYSSQFL
jgi:hypothetical protein